MAYEDFLVDKRVVERHIKKGLVEAEALKRQIEALPDRESNLVHVSLDGGVQANTAGDLVDDDDVEDDDDEDDLDEPAG